MNEDLFEFQFKSLLKSSSTDKNHIIKHNTKDIDYGIDSLDVSKYIKIFKFVAFGHLVTVPKVLLGRRVAMFTFQQICGEAYGSVDYIEISRKFPIIFLGHVPELSISNRNEVCVVCVRVCVCVCECVCVRVCVCVCDIILYNQ